jgi:hypothetical protein
MNTFAFVFTRGQSWRAGSVTVCVVEGAMMKSHSEVGRWIGLVLLIMCASISAACQVTEARPYVVAASTQKDGDAVIPTAQGERLILDITSPSGIGAARATILSAAQPEAIELRLHLQGLEEFRFAYGEQVITIAVPSVGQGAARATVVQAEGGEVALTSESPYWMEVRVEQGDPGSATPTPLFVVQAPPDFLQRGERNFEVSWIDFYR